MNRLKQSLLVLAGCAVLWTGRVRAEEHKPQAQTVLLADMQTELPRWVGIIETLGQGNLDLGLDLIEAELPRPFSKVNGPFEEDAREHWRQQFSKLAALNAKFESVDLVGYQPLSSASRTLVFIGHGKWGPILFRYRVFRYQGKWDISSLSYYRAWDHIEANANYIRFPTPISYPLAPKPLAQTDED